MIDRLVYDFGRIIGEAFGDSGRLYRSLPNDGWNGPTSCAKWTMHDLAGHTVGEAVWFARVVRGVTKGMRPLDDSVWDALKQLPGEVIADTLIGAADDLEFAIEGAETEHLPRQVDLGWKQMPLWRALHIAVSEAVYYNWDAHVGLDPRATIRTSWAKQVATFAADVAPNLARWDRARDAAGTYLLEVGNDVGPVTVTASEGTVDVERRAALQPDLTLRLTADQYVRLFAERLPLDSAVANGEVQVAGDRGRADRLNQLFPGIGN
ncbi:MAG: maleylpyruvate isomerase N-terminal domain-containing protein [Chloroflexota bacterium]